MKKLRKLFALVAAMAMVLALCSTAFAEGTTEYKYDVYQIFTGDYSNGKLSNLKWGANGTGELGTNVSETVCDELDAVPSTASDKVKLETILKYADLASTAFRVNAAAPITELPAGYYLVRDAANVVLEDDAYTTYIVKVTDGTLTIKRKAATTTFDKQVWDEPEDAETPGGDGWGESADHAINEQFQYKLIAQLPNDASLDQYKAYKLVFHDVMGTGVTFDKIDSVTVNGTPISADAYACTAVAGTKGNGSSEWTLTIADLKQLVSDIKGTTVTVIYTAHLNEEAEVLSTSTEGTANNQNKGYLQYSNKWDSDSLGKTEYDYVFVLTYEVDNTKYENKVAKENALNGAGFKLYIDEACETEYGLIWDATMSAYRPVKAGETAEEMFSGKGDAEGTESGIFNIKGLDTGVYYLKETTTPAGFNTCANIKVKIDSVHKENPDKTTVQATLTTENTNNNIINKSGATLPETGGMGTTIIYVVGAILVIGATILLVTKKRMSVEK